MTFLYGSERRFAFIVEGVLTTLYTKTSLT